MSEVIIKMRGTENEVFLIKDKKYIKLVSYASQTITDGIKEGILIPIPFEEIIEKYSSLKMVELISKAQFAKFYQLS